MVVIAHQGDTVDLLCYRHFGHTRHVEAVLAANKGLSDTPFLQAGQAVILPDPDDTRTTNEIIQLWD